MGVKVLLACGGTGGHVFPALAVYRALQARHGVAGLMVGRLGGLEERLAREANVAFAGVPAVPMHRTRIWRNLSLPYTLLRAIRASRGLLKKERPDAVLATGGYVSLPTGIAARTLGIPVFVHESNAHPGVANRILARLVHTVFAGSPACVRALAGLRTELSGNPARERDSRDRATLRAQFGLSDSDRFLVILGGSQGARGVNRIIATELDDLLKAGWTLLWQTGPAGLDAARQAVGNRTGVRVEAFVSDVYAALGAADLALTRSGASVLAELALFALPSVLVPYPFATDNHQESNAREIAQAGAAELLVEREWAPGSAVSKLETLWARRTAAAQAMHSFSRPDAARDVADQIMAVVTAGRQA